jgi:hypothetical protein
LVESCTAKFRWSSGFRRRKVRIARIEILNNKDMLTAKIHEAIPLKKGNPYKEYTYLIRAEDSGAYCTPGNISSRVVTAGETRAGKP